MKMTTYYQLLRCSLMALILCGLTCPLVHAYNFTFTQQRPLTEILEEFSEKYGILFSYDSKSLEEIEVGFTFQQGESLESAIERLLVPINFGFEAYGNKYYVVYKKNRSGKKSLKKIGRYLEKIQKLEGDGDLRVQSNRKSDIEQFQAIGLAALALKAEKTINGTVTNEAGEPLVGATIRTKSGNQGALTDEEGRFELTIPDEVTTLIVSYIGYASLEVEIGGRTAIDITLSESVSQLDEVVVVGYGRQQKRDLTGSVSKVDGKDLADIPSPRVDQLLQGRAPGVQVTSVSGEPGAPASIRIRGGNSIQGDNEPLFVIDGIIVGQNFNLNNINTNDIESLEILKDATALSIYGTRGANGVIIITTKSGSGLDAGKPQVTFNIYSGRQYMLESVDFLDGPQHAAYSNEDAEFRGAALPFPDPNVPNVDWIDLATRDAPMTNMDLSLSGTSENQKVNYYVSGNYFDQEGIIRNSGIERYIFRANLDFNISEVVRTGFRLNLSRQRRENNKTSIGQLFRDHLPTRAVFDENGVFTTENPVSASIQTNPEADITLRDNHTNITNLLGSIYLELEPIEDLVIRSTISPEINNEKLNVFNPGALPQNFVINDGGDARVFIANSIGYINENTVSYSTDLGVNHRLNVLGGFTMQRFELETSDARSFQLSNDITGFNNLSFGSNPNRNEVGSDFDAFQLVSWLGRVNYVLNDKYLFTFVGRVDGSSRFAEGNKYGFFPSGAVAWRLSNEPFIQNLNVFDVLKLRASFGISGSQAIPSFRTLALLNFANTTFDGAEQAGVTLGRPANPDLTWETTQQLDIGLEAGFLKGRLTTELDFYIKETRDLLLNVQIPRQTGFVSQLQNLGELRNVGLELLINSVNVSKTNFTWSSTLTLSGNRNEVQDLGGVDLIDVVDPSASGQGGPGGRLIVGETAPVFVGVNYLGTWKSQEEIDASGQVGQDVGGPHFEDTNGDGAVTEDDFIVLGSPQPDFIYGLQNTLTFKNWSLDFFFQGTVGNEVFNSLTQTAFFGRAELTKYAETLNRWTPENPMSDIPRAGAVAALSEIKSNSEQIEDATHLRLKNLRLGYSFPVDDWGWNNFSTIEVYFTGSNLFVLSDFRLTDPETSAFGRSNVAVGFSQGEYPSARVLSLGLRVVL